MVLPPESHVDSMPCDPDLLVELGRVTWAAARLHAGVRDAINQHQGQASDQPFTLTLGQAVSRLEEAAKLAGRADQVDWVSNLGRPAVRLRNTVVHAVTYTAVDGKQAIGTVDHGPPGRFLVDELRQVTLHLIHASMTLPV
ncbi:MAG TPA: hypothetical protein VF635_17660 [Propionibacteriaceae bacterium]|jgi:hypothetical protein